MMEEGYCPECDSKISLGRDPQEGQKVTCSSCGAYLEVVGLSPIDLDWAFDENEDDDWDEEEEDDDDWDD
jgi:alpha-aminoadipate carrier protein LysW